MSRQQMTYPLASQHPTLKKGSVYKKFGAAGIWAAPHFNSMTLHESIKGFMARANYFWQFDC